jgi:ligand-binding sensor domain-containing protein
MDLFLATNKGLLVAEQAGDGWEISSRGLENRQVTCVIARAGALLAGTKNGVYRSDDLGES